MARIAREMPRFACLKRSAKNTISAALATLTVGQREDVRTGVVLYYHDLIPDMSASVDMRTERVPVSATLFETHMRCLRDWGYKLVGLRELVALCSRPNPTPNLVSLTFDDGWEGVYKYAFPLLHRMQIPCTVFLITGNVGKAGFLSRAQVREMVGARIEFGGHTRSHADLSALSVHDAFEEIAGCRYDLEGMIGRHCGGFCYPYGRYTSRIPRLVEATNFEYACGSQFGVNSHISGRRRFTLRRYLVAGEESPSQLMMKLEGAYDWVSLVQGLRLRWLDAKALSARLTLTKRIKLR